MQGSRKSVLWGKKKEARSRRRVAAAAAAMVAALALPSLAFAGAPKPTTPDALLSAAKANPTFVSIWSGNNDVLEAAVSGVVVATPGVSRGVTLQTDFETAYNNLLRAIFQPGTVRGGVLIHGGFGG